MAELKLFGGVVVMDDRGEPSPLSARRHPVALLALLATAPSRTLSRGKVVGLLWPEVAEKAARNRLTSCVYDVRAALGPGVLESAGDDLRLNVPELACDVCRFVDAVAAEDHGRAVALYGGPLLDGFQLGGSVEFEQRMDHERDRLRWDYQRAVEALARQAAGRGDRDAAVNLWRMRAADDPFDTRIAAELVRALSGAGNRREALRVADGHARLLEDELGAEPDAAFRRLVERVRVPDGDEAFHIATGDLHEEPAIELPERSIAILPFEPLGEAADATPFAAGLHDDLLTELSRNSALTVISRTSVERYRGSRRPLREIARELGVGTIVEGAVQCVGGRMRLNVQLIDARRDAHRWVERYERRLGRDDIFDIQSELAEKIARTLHAELTVEERARVRKEPTSDLEAFRLFVKGRALLDQRTPHEMTRAIEYFQRAIERDPEYALAWSGLADALSLLEFYHYPAPAPAPALDPLEAARRAVACDPELGAAHASLGIVLAVRQQGAAALDALETALALSPSDAEAQVWLAWVQLLRGAPREALAGMQRAVELDPLSTPAYHVYLAEARLVNGDRELALEACRRARAMRPEYGLAHFVEALTLYHLRRHAEAADALERARALVPPHGMPAHAEVDALEALTLIASGRREAAVGLLARLRKRGHRFSTGLVLAALGEVDAAFAEFDSVTEWRAFSNEHVRYLFPDVLGPLREDDRYALILQRVNDAWEGGAVGAS